VAGIGVLASYFKASGNITPYNGQTDISFSNIETTFSTDITKTYDTSFNLATGRTYRLRGCPGAFVFSNPGGVVTLQWYINGTPVGLSTNYDADNTTGSISPTFGTCEYIYTNNTGSSVVASLRIIYNVSLIQIGYGNNLPWAEIQVIGGNAPVTLGVTGSTGPTGPTGPNVWSVLPNLDIYYLSGNVGIGTSRPIYPLDFSGNIRITNSNAQILLQGNTNKNLGIGTGISSITSGQQNTVVGLNTMTVTTGSFNTAIGYNALPNPIGSTYNTAIGYNAYSGTTYNNSTAVGYSAQPNANNQIVLGTANEFVSIPGTADSSSTTSGALQVVGGVGVGGTVTATYFITTSDYRMKQNAQPITITRTIDVLKPVEYDLSGGRHDMGFLAHEVQEVLPFLVIGDKDGPHMQSLNYNGFIALLVKEMKEMKLRLTKAESQIARFERTRR